jgi:flagellar protein FliJ
VNPSRFTFPLERVRALRERTEDQAKEELAASLAHRMRGEAMLRAAGEAVSGARELHRGAMSQASGTDLLLAQAYVERTARAREAASLELDRRDSEVEARRNALQHAARDRQVLERLKDRRRAEHKQEMARREGIALDEIALDMHRRGHVFGAAA